jgi:hypothetical protein
MLKAIQDYKRIKAAIVIQKILKGYLIRKRNENELIQFKLQENQKYFDLL